MNMETFEHKDELDCEVTIFDGALTTCDRIGEGASKNIEARKIESSSVKSAYEDYDVRMIY